MDWELIGEGNANVVFAYAGEDPQLVGKVLRVRKRSFKERTHVSLISQFEERLWKGYVQWSSDPQKRELDYIQHVMAPMLGREYVFPGVPCGIPSEVEQRVKSTGQELDGGLPGLLAPNHTLFCHERGCQKGIGPVISVEIKPKSGGQPSPNEVIHPDRSIKAHYPRYRLHQLYKYATHHVSEISGYNPQDLFSGKREAVEKALNHLFQAPQNNLRVFRDGERCFGDGFNGDILHSRPPTNGDVPPPPAPTNGDAPAGQPPANAVESSTSASSDNNGSHGGRSSGGEAEVAVANGGGEGHGGAMKGGGKDAGGVRDQGGEGGGEEGWWELLQQQLDGFAPEVEDAGSVGQLLVRLLSQVLQEEGVLRPLQRVQDLDTCGVEGAYLLYCHLMHTTHHLHPTPSGQLLPLSKALPPTSSPSPSTLPSWPSHDPLPDTPLPASPSLPSLASATSSLSLSSTPTTTPTVSSATIQVAPSVPDTPTRTPPPPSVPPSAALNDPAVVLASELTHIAALKLQRAPKRPPADLAAAAHQILLPLPTPTPNPTLASTPSAPPPPSPTPFNTLNTAAIAAAAGLDLTPSGEPAASAYLVALQRLLSLDPEQALQALRNHLIAATAKDCAIMVTLQQIAAPPAPRRLRSAASGVGTGSRRVRAGSPALSRLRSMCRCASHGGAGLDAQMSWPLAAGMQDSAMESELLGFASVGNSGVGFSPPLQGRMLGDSPLSCSPLSLSPSHGGSSAGGSPGDWLHPQSSAQLGGVANSTGHRQVVKYLQDEETGLHFMFKVSFVDLDIKPVIKLPSKFKMDYMIAACALQCLAALHQPGSSD